MSALIKKFSDEPALVTGAVVGLVIFLAGHFGVILDEATVTEVVSPLVVALLVRSKVTPNSKVLASK
mgnify:CR=1 FL=1